MYQFTEDCLTGIEAIDQEHRQLFQLINEAFGFLGNSAETAAGAKNLLAALKKYAATHFAHEEEYMESIDYTGLEAQRRAHGVFLAKLADKDEAENAENRLEFVEDMLDFLFAWLTRHILKMDKLIPVK